MCLRGLQTVGLVLSLTIILSAWQISQSQPTEKHAVSHPTSVIAPKPYTARADDAVSQAGKQEFVKLNCANCHSINNVGGTNGPILDGIGARRDQQFLYDRLANEPSAIKKFDALTHHRLTELPKHPRVSAANAGSLVAYLLTLPQPAGGFRITAHPEANAESEALPGLSPYNAQPKTASADAGEKLYFKFGCAQCHSIGDVGGDLGPALDGIGEFHKRDYIMAHISNAQVVAVQNSPISAFAPTPMPKFNATPQEIEQIADFLMTLPERP